MKPPKPTRILITDEPSELEREHDLKTRSLLGRLPDLYEPFTDLLA